jgi:hypothetical protein
MSAIDASDHRTRKVRMRQASALWSLAAAVLLLTSAALQLVASLQRWVVFRSASDEFVAEDHLYDYVWPYAPWEPIGNAAELFGAGVLLLAPGVVLMAIGVSASSRFGGHHPAIGVIVIVGEIALALLVAGSFAVAGAHPFLSGIAGAPSQLRDDGGSGWLAIFGLIGLCALWLHRSPAAMVTCVFLIGSTGVGHLIAAFNVAPFLAGYVSHDSTPWTETVIAAWTAAAGFMVILAAVDAARRGALSVRHRDVGAPKGGTGTAAG